MTYTDKEQQIRVEIIPRLNRFVDMLWDCPNTPPQRARLLGKLVDSLTQILDSNEPT
jgi:hypothetical protein